MKSTKSTLAFRRKREGKTNYKKRLSFLKSGKPRIVIRRSLQGIVIQIVEYHVDGDKVLSSADSKQLKKYGWKVTTGNTPAAYLTGFLLAKKAQAKGIKEGIVDLGLQQSTKMSRIYGAVKGLIDGGFKLPFSEEILPDDNRINGKHIEEFAKALASEKEKYNKQFSNYIKVGVKPEELSKLLAQTKEKISQGA